MARKIKVTTYAHHGRTVHVQAKLQGRHREHCLCYTCERFTPEDRENGCPIANAVFANCRAHGIVTPVWECPEYAGRPELVQLVVPEG